MSGNWEAVLQNDYQEMLRKGCMTGFMMQIKKAILSG